MKTAEERREGDLMPTNTERREVAARLRECKRTKDNPTATFDWAIYAALDPEWYRQENWIPYNAAVDRLADLIEPSEAEEWVTSQGLTKEQLEFDWWLSGRVMHELGFDGDTADRDEVESRLLARLMPEDMEWPRYESGELVRFGDSFLDHQGNVRSVLRIDLWQEGGFALYTGQGTEDWHSAGERVKRPSVLAADGEPLEVGQTVYVIANGKTHHVTEVDAVSKRFRSMEQVDGSHWLDPMCFTHQRPVLDADGVPICGGECVLGINGGLYRVTDASCGEVFARHVGGPFGAEVESAGGEGLYRLRANRLTHTKPEPTDSWERIEEDIEKSFSEYWGCEKVGCSRCPALIDGQTPHEFFGCSHNCTIAMKRDIMRRCRALAERERGE